jgi:hypothetical protein
MPLRSVRTQGARTARSTPSPPRPKIRLAHVWSSNARRGIQQAVPRVIQMLPARSRRRRSRPPRSRGHPSTGQSLTANCVVASSSAVRLEQASLGHGAHHAVGVSTFPHVPRFSSVPRPDCTSGKIARHAVGPKTHTLWPAQEDTETRRSVRVRRPHRHSRIQRVETVSCTRVTSHSTRRRLAPSPPPGYPADDPPPSRA